eukprot:3532473-Rhodomonas_salina.1
MLRSSQASELSSQRDVESGSQRVCTGVCTQVSGAALGAANETLTRASYPPLAGSSTSSSTPTTSIFITSGTVTHA